MRNEKWAACPFLISHLCYRWKRGLNNTTPQSYLSSARRHRPRRHSATTAPTVYIRLPRRRPILHDCSLCPHRHPPVWQPSFLPSVSPTSSYHPPALPPCQRSAAETQSEHTLAFQIIVDNKSGITRPQHRKEYQQLRHIGPQACKHATCTGCQGCDARRSNGHQNQMQHQSCSACHGWVFFHFLPISLQRFFITMSRRTLRRKSAATTAIIIL